MKKGRFLIAAIALLSALTYVPAVSGICTEYGNHKIGVYMGDMDCVFKLYRTCEKCTDAGGLVCLNSEVGECIENAPS